MSSSESSYAEPMELPLNVPRLPPVHEQPFAHIKEYQQAYHYITTTERRAVRLYNSDQSDENLRERVVCVRIVGLFLVEFYKKSFVLGELPCLEIVRRVCAAEQCLEGGEDRLVELGEVYRDYLIRGFLIVYPECYERYTMIYPCNGHNPEEGDYDTGSESDDNEDGFETLDDIRKRWLEGTGNKYRTVSRKVSVRDDFRCVVTGCLNTFRDIRSDCHLGLIRWINGELSAPTFCGLIISDYMVDPIPKKGFSSARFLEVMEDLQLQDLVTDFMESKGGSVNDPRNMLTMTIGPLTSFNGLYFWFEPTADPCEYTTHLPFASIMKYIPVVKEKLVRLESRGGIPPPDRRLLTFHGVCSRVGNLSGAADWDYEVAYEEIDEPIEGDSKEAVRCLSTKL